MTNLKNENKSCNSCCSGRGSESTAKTILDGLTKDVILSLGFAAVLMGDMKDEDLPNASPLDLLSEKDYEHLDKYLNEEFGPLRNYIDENYAALLVALSEYEDVDLEKRLIAHIAQNLAKSA